MKKILLYQYKAYAFLLIVSTPLLAASQEFDRITHTSTAQEDVWVIKRPNVKRKETEYPQITYKEGDRIVVSAGGCVQTGGSGRTWKRYLNPRPSSDNLYYSSIYIPGMTMGWQRLSEVVGKPKRIPVKAEIGDKLFVRLAYKDDEYGDNGYWKHDDGTDNQCRGVRDAFVVIKIKH